MYFVNYFEAASTIFILGYEQDGVTEIQEGMKGSKITIDDFSEKKNSMFSADCQDKLIETLEKLNITLESFNNKTHSEKGGEKVMNKFEELCEKYNKTADEVTFEYENLSDEELEVAFKEAFEESDEETENVVEETVVVDETEEIVIEESVEEVVEETEEVITEEVVEEEPVEEIVETEEKFVLKYELSHDDIRSALYSLLAAESDEEYCYAWILEVFDNKFIYQDYMENKFYRRGYSKDDENVVLDDNKVEVFNEWLSKAEKDALDALKADYAILKAFKADVDAAQLQAQKDAIFAKEEFARVVNTKAFKKLIENSKDYTIEECEQKAKDILDDCNDFVTNFAAKDEDDKKSDTIGFNFNKKESKKGPYGNLFSKD